MFLFIYIFGHYSFLYSWLHAWLTGCNSPMSFPSGVLLRIDYLVPKIFRLGDCLQREQHKHSKVVCCCRLKVLAKTKLRHEGFNVYMFFSEFFYKKTSYPQICNPYFPTKLWLLIAIQPKVELYYNFLYSQHSTKDIQHILFQQ